MADEILQGYPIPAFFQAQKGHMDWKEDTVHRYKKYLYELLNYLNGREATRESLEPWKRQIEARYSYSGVHGYLAAVNNYFLWCGRPDLYLRRTPNEKSEKESQPPAVTRSEYLKLLRTARRLDRRRTYLLIKLFALTGVPLQCLEQVTVELVQKGEGTLSVPNRKENEFPFYCPEGLQKEILSYVAQQGIYHGPVFISSRGNLMGRQAICRDLKEICLAAGISQDKGNPGSLRRLYRETQENIDRQLDQLRRKMYDQMLELEQDAVGWMPEDAPPNLLFA